MMSSGLANAARAFPTVACRKADLLAFARSLPETWTSRSSSGCSVKYHLPAVAPPAPAVDCE